MSTNENSTPQVPEELFNQLLQHLNDPKELTGPGGLMGQLMGRMVERALETELTAHLGYERGERRVGENARNGATPKRVRGESGDAIDIEVPRDREGTFEPQLVRKHQRRLAGFDERIIALYSRGMSVREIEDFFTEAYDATVPRSLISRVTDSVKEDIEAWQQRTLDAVYPIVYLDGLVVKVKVDGMVQKRTVYLALGVNMEGKKEVLGLWMAATEGAKFWLHVVTELSNRGVRDILIACCDGLKGFPEAIESVFPHAVVQCCVVHQVRHSLAFVSYKNRRVLAAALKTIYRAPTLEQAEAALDTFEEEWGKQYPSIVKSWRANWDRITPFFAFPEDIRTAIYTTNAIEAVNRQVRKAIKTKGHFPTEEAIMKTLFMALQHASKKWTMPIRKWDMALQQFAIHFEGRLAL